MIQIPIGLDWTKELNCLVRLLSMDALKELDFNNITADSLIACFKAIKYEDVAILAESDILIFSFHAIIDFVLESTGLADVIVIPAGMDWVSELYSLFALFNISAINKLDLNNINLDSILEFVKALSYEDVQAITGSNLIMANFDNLLRNAIDDAGLGDMVTIPAGTNWTEELYGIVKLLNIELLADVDLSALTLESILELLQDISKEDLAIITESRLIMFNVDPLI